MHFIFDSIEHGLPLRRITSELNRLGYPAPNGHGWFTSRVKDIAGNPIYMGTLVWGRRNRKRVDLAKLTAPPTRDGKEVLVIHGFVKNPPITEEQFLRVQAILDGNSTLWERRRACAPKCLFSGLIRCPECGLLYSGVRHNGTKRVLYRHNATHDVNDERRKCPNYLKYIRSEDLDAFICSQIRDLLSDPQLIDRVRKEIQQSIEGTDLQDTRKQVRDLRRRIEKKESTLQQLKKSLDKADNEIALGVVISSINSVGQAITGMREELDRWKEKEHSLASHLDLHVRVLSNQAALVQQLDSDSFEVRRTVVQQLVEYVNARAIRQEIVIAIRYI